MRGAGRGPGRTRPASGLGLRLGRLGLPGHAELLEHAQGVPAAPRLDDLAVLDAIDRGPGDLDAPAAGRIAHQLSLVSTGCRPACGDQIALGYLLFDREARIGERPDVHLDELLQALEPFFAERVVGVVVDGVSCDEAVERVEVAALPGLEDTSRDGLVVLRHSGLLS